MLIITPASERGNPKALPTPSPTQCHAIVTPGRRVRTACARLVALSLIGTSLLPVLALACPPDATLVPRPPVIAAVGDPRPPADPMPANTKPVIQIALLLDTSNSMDGLIAQAKSELWSIVNSLAMAKRRGERSELRVALYEYGNDGLSPGEGFVRMVSPFTSDLDLISEKLFSLRTNGGSEFCGKVIQDAAGQLAWSGAPDDLRLIVIAGNEPFTQGQTDYRAAVPFATAKGIVVNTVFCGSRDSSDSVSWADGAKLGGGTFATINTSANMNYIRCPQDGRISQLGADLNTTYLAYGARGPEGFMRQRDQDAAAESAAPGASVHRALAKNSALYSNTHWDLVDAVNQKALALCDLKDDELPQDMRVMSLREREEHVQALTARRAAIQQELAQLQREREGFLARQHRAADPAAQTLGAVLVEALRAEAARNGFEFGN